MLMIPGLIRIKVLYPKYFAIRIILHLTPILQPLSYIILAPFISILG
jgi:hypothetical protein